MRLSVPLLLLAAGAWNSAPSAGIDVVLLRDGTRRLGVLRACIGESCRFDDQALPRPQVARIGFATDETAAPAVGDPTRDEVRLRDGSLHPGRIEGISLGSVLAASGAYDRAEVAWVYFAPEAVAPAPERIGGAGGGGPGGQGATTPESEPPPERPPAPPEGEPTDSPPATPPPPPRLPPRAPPASQVEPCPPAQPLGGYVEIRVEGERTQQWRRESVTRLWFRLRPFFGDPVGKGPLLKGELDGLMTWRVEATACTDLPGTAGFATEVCSCPAGGGTGRTEKATVGFHALRPELRITLPQEVRESADVELRCQDLTGDSRSLASAMVSTSYDIGPDCALQICTPPTACSDPDPRDPCLAEPARYAALPFTGEGEVPGPGRPGDHGLRERVRWDICCGCGEPIGKGPEPESDPCGDPAAARGLAEVADLEAQRRRDELRELWRQVESEWHQAEALQNPYREAILKCAAWETGMKLLEFFAGGPEAPAGAQAFFQVFNLARQLLEGDPSATLAMAGGVDEIDVGGIWGTVSDVVNGVQDAARAGSIPSMRSRLEDCAGTPILSGPTYSGALAYLDHLEAALRNLPRARQLMTEIGQWDVESWQRARAAHEACLEWARCKGFDAAVCGPAPAEPR